MSEKKIKVLLIGFSSNIGGIETYLINLIKKANFNEFQFDVLSATENKIAFQDELENLNCRIFKITPRFNNPILHMYELKKILKENQYDILHYNIMCYSWYEPIIYSNKYNRAKIILHSHCGSKEYLKDKSIFTKILNKIGKYRCRKVKTYNVSCSDKAGKYMFNNKCIKTFINGIDYEKFKFKESFREEIRNKFLIESSTTVIGLTASLLPVKNHKFLLNVFYEYNKLNSNSKLFLLGEGYLKSELQKKCRELEIQDKVIFLSSRDDCYKYYSAFDIYVTPSISEGFSISLCEALINGLKCYASSCYDKKNDISGNVVFLSLDEPGKEWAKYIFENANYRDYNVQKKISDDYNVNNTCKEVFDFYRTL